jgi:hypothetical protein
MVEFINIILTAVFGLIVLAIIVGLIWLFVFRPFTILIPVLLLTGYWIGKMLLELFN